MNIRLLYNRIELVITALVVMAVALIFLVGGGNGYALVMEMGVAAVLTIRAVTASFTPGKEKLSCILISTAMFMYVAVAHDILTPGISRKDLDRLEREADHLKDQIDSLEAQINSIKIKQQSGTSKPSRCAILPATSIPSRHAPPLRRKSINCA